jgi:hypothetical protein
MSVWTTTAVKQSAKRKVAAPAISEKHVQQAVIQLLEAEGWLVVRVHVGMFKGWTRGTPISMNKGKEGFPDLIAVTSVMHTPVPPNIAKDCRVLFIETKRGKGGKLSHEQEQWAAHLQAQGFEWLMADGVSAVQEYLNA